MFSIHMGIVSFLKRERLASGYIQRVRKKRDQMFLVIYQTKRGRFWRNLVHGFLNKFAIKWQTFLWQKSTFIGKTQRHTLLVTTLRHSHDDVCLLWHAMRECYKHEWVLVCMSEVSGRQQRLTVSQCTGGHQRGLEMLRQSHRWCWMWSVSTRWDVCTTSASATHWHNLLQ